LRRRASDPRLALATTIGNRGVVRLMRDPVDKQPQAAKLKGTWIKFAGKGGSHGDWIRLGDYGVGDPGEDQDFKASFDLQVESSKALRLGAALDSGELLTVMLEDRDDKGHANPGSRRELLEATITSVAATVYKPPDDQDRSHWRRVIRVELTYKGEHHRASQP
jgi:hypothetical protein